MKTLAIYLSFIVTVIGEPMTPSPTIQKYNGLFMPISEKNSDLFYFLMRGETIVGDDKRIQLDDDAFIQAIKETEGHRIYQLRIRGSAVTHIGIEALKGQEELRYLDLSNNKLITDVACKKIAEYFPRLERLNLFNTFVSNKGLSYLIDLQELRQLHIGETNITWDAANEFRGKMEAIGGNDDLEITTGYHAQPLGSIKYNKWLRSHYQKNVELSNIDEEAILKKHLLLSPDKVKSNKTYEEDKKKEADGPILEQ
tara:strand:- start:4641 stop:5405 length:765 start_codon:yes stop_codon:yes gene_type:complete